MSKTFADILKILDEAQITYKQLHHEITLTSEDSARVRGEAISIGGKALVVKVDKTFKLFVLSASRKFNSSVIKKHFKAKKLRFASKDELMELTDLVPGSVPPFGHPILNLDLYVDESIMKNEKIAFNAGSLTDSIIMQVKDYMKIANPEIFNFSSER